MAAQADIHAVPKRPEFLQGFFGLFFWPPKKPWEFLPSVPQTAVINGCFNWMIPNLYVENGCFTKHPCTNGCFNWMIPNLHVENGCFTKHPFINGCLGFQVVEWLFLVPVKRGR